MEFFSRNYSVDFIFFITARWLDHKTETQATWDRTHRVRKACIHRRENHLQTQQGGTSQVQELPDKISLQIALRKYVQLFSKKGFFVLNWMSKNSFPN